MILKMISERCYKCHPGHQLCHSGPWHVGRDRRAVTRNLEKLKRPNGNCLVFLLFFWILTPDPDPGSE